MTQIVSTLPLTTAPGSPAKTPTVNGDAWRKEMERARWEAQPRYRAGDSGPDARGAPDHVLFASEASVTSALAREGEPTAGRQNAGTRDPQAANAPSTQPTLDTATFVARATGQPLAAGPLPLAATEHMQQALLRSLRSQARTRSGEPWSERNVHVQPEGEAWAVWIRDADITPERVADMLDAIARLAGEVGQPRRIRLTVNGQPFTAASDNTPLAGDRLGN